MTLTLYQLQPPPGGGFHFGEEGLELEESSLSFPSDSLFAALVATIAEQEGKTAADEFVGHFVPTHPNWTGQPPFRLTSVFPYVGSLPLFPLPQLLIPVKDTTLLPRKFAKKVQFVSPGILGRLCRGVTLDDCLPGGKNGRFLQEQAVWLTTEEQAHLPGKWAKLPAENLQEQAVWQKGGVPRVTLDRITNISTVFQVGRVVLNSGCGWWLGVQYHDATWQDRVKMLLHHLGHRGIGGDRTNGYGAFTLLAENNLTFLLPSDATNNSHHLLLSRFYPRPTETLALRDDQANYRLVPVSGWLAAPGVQPLRRKRVHLIAEGSVLGTVAGGLQGDLADVTPDAALLPEGVRPPAHRIYRYGYALTTPVTLKER